MILSRRVRNQWEVPDLTNLDTLLSCRLRKASNLEISCRTAGRRDWSRWAGRAHISARIYHPLELANWSGSSYVPPADLDTSQSSAPPTCGSAMNETELDQNSSLPPRSW